MSFVFRDRIHGVKRESITSLAVTGQWVLETSGGVWHNREPARTLDYLLPDGRQGWSVQDDETRRVGRFDPALLPSERDIARILDIGKEITNHLEQPSAWDGLIQVSLVMRNLDERARLQRLERDIERCLGPLKHVCKRPRLHLHSEQERVPTARARRIPSQATSYLAAHSENWEVRTVRGVRPRRLLATVAEDLWDIYENHVAVRLVDHLLRDVSLPAGLSWDSRQPGSHCAPDRPGLPPGSGRCSSTWKPLRRASSRPEALGVPGGEQLVLLYLGQGEDERISPAQQHLLNRLGFEHGRSEPDAYGLLHISTADVGSEGTRGTSASVVAHGLTAAALRAAHPRATSFCSTPWRNTCGGTWNERATESCAWHDF